MRYAAVGGTKTLEGSFAFFSVAFLVTQVGLLLHGRDPLETVLIASTLALAVTLLEALAGKGSDNLLIPLVALVLLKTYLGMDAAALAVHFLAAMVLGPALVLWRWRQLNARL